MNPETHLLAAVGAPLAAVLPILALRRHPNARESVTLTAAVCLFALVLTLVPVVEGGGRPVVWVVETLPGLAIGLQAEPLGLLFALLASFLWIVTSVYSIGYLRAHREAHQTRFYSCFALALGSTVGVAFAANLFTLFVFYELLTLTTYPLVTHAGTDAARRAGRLYLGLLLGTSVGLLLLALIATWSLTGTLAFREGGTLGGAVAPGTAGILLALYVFGIGKAAVMPFHWWLPAAMVAPTPVSALLHAVAVVKAGVFAVLKIAVYVFGLDFLATIPLTEWLMYAAAATMLVASVVALRQDNLKLRLAYSTVGQLSYIVLGALLATPAGVVGGAMHMVMHAFGKITLFFCAGAILVATHKTRISEMDGIGRQMPLTMAAFFAASLSIIGIPPLGGFWSKWFLGLATLDAGQMAMLVIILASSLLSVAYLLPIPLRAFFGSGAVGSEAPRREAPLPCLVALLCTALGCLVLFFAPQPLYRLIHLLAAVGPG